VDPVTHKTAGLAEVPPEEPHDLQHQVEQQLRAEGDLSYVQF
jgi:hypothetical protein